MKPALQNGLILAVLTGLIGISTYQFGISLAHVLLEDELRSWQQRNVLATSYAGWKKKEPLVANLAELSPSNGLVLQNSARFYILGSELAASSTITANDSKVHLELAKRLIRSSLGSQPVWPLAWMDLSFIQSSLGDFGDEFQLSFARAFDTGRGERDVLRGLSDLGFTHWRELSPDNRQLFVRMLEIAVRRDLQYVMNAAERHSRSYIPCLLIETAEVVHPACKNR